MTTWAEYLDVLEILLAEVEEGIAAADIDCAATAISALEESELRRGLPDLTMDDAPRARRANERLAAAEAWIRGAMARVRPELTLVGSLVDSGTATSRYVDESA